MLIAALEGDFARYMQTFSPFLQAALQNHQEHQLCTIAIGLTGDICRALGSQVIPYCDMFMNLLMSNLVDTSIHQDVKPPILSCFGDVALAIGGAFELYLSAVMGGILSACNFKATEGDEEMEDYVIILRENVLEGLVGIVQGLKSDGKAMLLAPYLKDVFVFLEDTANGNYGNEAHQTETGLLGDLAEAFSSGEMRQVLSAEWVLQLLRRARTSPEATQSQKEVAKWAREMVKRAIS